MALALTRWNPRPRPGGHQSAALRHDCELWRLNQSIFGGTTEIMKEIIGRGLGL